MARIAKRTQLVRCHGLSSRQAVHLSPGLDGILRHRRGLPRYPGGRRLDSSASAAVLLETMAQVPNLGSEAACFLNRTVYRHSGRSEPQRSVGHVPQTGGPFRHDQPMAEGSRFSFCQRPVGEAALPGYGPVVSSKRLGSDPHAGWCGGWGSKTPGYPIRAFFNKLRQRGKDHPRIQTPAV